MVVKGGLNNNDMDDMKKSRFGGWLVEINSFSLVAILQNNHVKKYNFFSVD